MFITDVNLKCFRNLSDAKVELCDGINVLFGKNAQGKTNFIEGIYLCGTGRSLRGCSDFDLVQFNSSAAHAQVLLNTSDKIDVHIAQAKTICVNNNQIKKLGELFGILLTVTFSPEDLLLIKSNPSFRRRFMDIELCQINKMYYYELKQYYRVLRQRNALLKQSACESLDSWDEQLVSHGTNIMRFRQLFINELNEYAKKTHAHITNNSETLQIVYKPNVNTLHDEFRDKLKKKHAYDKMIGSTSVGIHKDNLIFMVNNIDAKIYGSQGQQKTVAISTKLAEIELIKQRTGKMPVLLLDDVLSELDSSRQSFLFENLNMQVIMTCTEEINLGKLFEVKEGKIS